MSKLTREEIMAIQVMRKKDMSNRELARKFGVDESTIRYHLTRKGKADGRTNKPQRAEEVAEVINRWLDENKPEGDRPPNAKALWEYLVDTLDYKGSYKSVLRYLRRHLPLPKMRPKRRVETPPGLQAQVDWGEFKINIQGFLEKLYAFVLTLSFSRAFTVVWSKSMDMLSWLNCHNQAFKTLGGIPYVVRIDNLKTAVIKGAGPKAKVNPTYTSYAKELRFVVDPCRAYTPTDKGKVEAKVKLTRYGINPEKQAFSSMEELSSWTDRVAISRFERLKNPLTGGSIFEAWKDEKKVLQPLPPFMPEPFDKVVSRKVSDDCLVCFEGRKYSVPFQFIRQSVEVRGTVHEVLIFSGGILVASHERKTERRLLIDQNHYEGEASEGVFSPTPLGKLTRAQLDLWKIPVEKRPLDLYEQLLEVRDNAFD